MYPVQVYCCGEIIVCNKTVNTCETCGSDYNREGDRTNHVFPWEKHFLFSEPDEVIIVKEGMTA
jgi:hypothetical protein